MCLVYLRFHLNFFFIAKILSSIPKKALLKKKSVGTVRIIVTEGLDSLLY